LWYEIAASILLLRETRKGDNLRVASTFSKRGQPTLRLSRSTRTTTLAARDSLGARFAEFRILSIVGRLSGETLVVEISMRVDIPLACRPDSLRRDSQATMASMVRHPLRSCTRITTRAAAVSRSPTLAGSPTICRPSPVQQVGGVQIYERFSRRRYHDSGRREGKQQNTYQSIPVLSFIFGSFFGPGSDDTPDLTPFKYTSSLTFKSLRTPEKRLAI
jgi:hypothetical protein